MTSVVVDFLTVLDIVLGREHNPERAVLSTPSDGSSRDADMAQERPITAAQRRSIEKWEHRHDLARQALLACLEAAELMKVYQLKSAHQIWKRLTDDYLRILFIVKEISYIHARTHQ